MGEVRMTDAAAKVINDRFDNLSAEFDNSRSLISTYAAQMLTGAGEFSSTVETGAGSFDISWRDSFEVCCNSAGLIAGNTNRFKVSLERIDTDYSWAIAL